MSICALNHECHQRYLHLQYINSLLLNMESVYEPLASAIDTPAYKIDGCECELAKAITSFINDNPHLFKKKNLKEKVEIIFDAYRDAYFSVIQKDLSYKKALELLKKSDLKYIGLSSQLELAAELLVFNRVKMLHSKTYMKAIEICTDCKQDNYINVNSFPDSYEHRSANLNALTDLFRKILYSRDM